jgi:hypothetical protein
MLAVRNEVIVIVFAVLSALQLYNDAYLPKVQDSDGITYQSVGNVI